MEKIDQLYDYVQKSISLQDVKKSVLNNEQVGVDAYEVEKKLGIVRNNASTLLNKLCKQGKLVKISGRPVKFIPRELLNNLLKPNDLNEEYTIDEIKCMFHNINATEKMDNDPFNNLIGSTSSLNSQVEQAKAAILYPPNGLHTLVLGPSGVGKTTFANTMYEFARLSKNKSDKEFPFVSFNCSDYFNNPQLLLSQLFGHVKGAFTGADTDKVGLVEKADGGILFLDEVHRLPPDGQEMLFFLIDKGEYHRLGETGTTRKSDVLIIAATTENPQEVLLKTFLRRIPVIINLPSLNERDIGERIEIIEWLFKEEALRVNRKLYISSEVLKALCIYECRGNIGQLKSDIKLLCAKSFLKYVKSNEDLKIEFSMLPQSVKDSIFNTNETSAKVHEFLRTFENDLVIYPSKQKYSGYKTLKENIYQDITNTLDELREKGLPEKEIDDFITNKIESYFKNVIKKFDNSSLKVEELYKVIDREVVDFTCEQVRYASQKLNRELNEKILFVLAFHLNFLIARTKAKEKVENRQLLKIREIYSAEYEVASSIVRRINERFDLTVPEDENGFIALLLANNGRESENDDNIGILVIAHGESTATSMANVCNRLLGSSIVKAIDMPLERSIKETYNKVTALIEAMDMGKGILILVDMGSLKGFGKKITEDKGIITRTIDRVSTPIVLEALRRVMYKNETIDEIYESLMEQMDISGIPQKQKDRVIITTCATGKGTSVMLKNIVCSILKDTGNTDINVIPIDFLSIVNNSEEYKQLMSKYDIIACVGNMNPHTETPYFSIEELLSENDKYRFYKFIQCNENSQVSKTRYDAAGEMLEDYLLYVNPKRAVECFKKFIESLDLRDKLNDDSFIINLTIHLGYMLERIITGNNAVFDKAGEFIAEHDRQFDNIRGVSSIIEEAYNIKITDDEICFIIQLINNSK